MQNSFTWVHTWVQAKAKFVLEYFARIAQWYSPTMANIEYQESDDDNSQTNPSPRAGILSMRSNKLRRPSRHGFSMTSTRQQKQRKVKNVSPEQEHFVFLNGIRTRN
jgi:hypothetical protein